VASTIGIKIANGEFYSILEENSLAKKRLVLTTVHNNQRSVQIDLYKSFTRTMADGLYIGSLVVEKIKPRARGEPSIELVISSQKDGNITADAVDMDASGHGEHHTLAVSLKSLDEDNLDANIPDFEMENNEPPPMGLYGKATLIHEIKEKRKFPWLIVIIIALLAAAIGLAIWLFLCKGGMSLFRSGQTSTSSSSGPSEPQAAVETPPQAVPPAPPAQTPAPPPVIQAPAQAQARAPAARARPVPPVLSYRVPSTIPREGVPYTIRYGDTLWDIAGAFYRNPWLYPRIARYNNIRNPDRIISGTTIRIPPRN
jgi:hypothetical protein